MKKKLLTVFGAILISSIAFPQSGNFGIGTTTPGSKLTVNGSFAPDYKIVTATGNVGVNDYYIAYNGAANGTLTLPAAISGTGNYKGRIYCFKNTGSTVLTVAANGTELIDNQGNVASLTIPAGYYAQFISKGTTTGSTWEVSLFVNGSIPAATSVTGVGGNFGIAKETTPGATERFLVNGNNYTIAYKSSYTFTLATNKALFLNYSLGIDDLTADFSNRPYFKCELYIDGIASGLFVIVQEINIGAQMQFNVSGIRNLSAGSHTIDARITRWFNNGAAADFNQDFGTLSSVFDAAYLN